MYNLPYLRRVTRHDAVNSRVAEIDAKFDLFPHFHSFIPHSLFVLPQRIPN